MFRSQFPYPTPARCQDQTFHYAFDGSNIPGLFGQLAAGAITQSGIPLLLQADAPFLLRGFKVAAFAGSPLLIQFKDCFGNELSDGYVPIDLYAAPSGAASIGSAVIPWEAGKQGLECPAGGTFWVYLQNPTNAPVDLPAITLYGVKRYPGVS